MWSMLIAGVVFESLQTHRKYKTNAPLYVNCMQFSLISLFRRESCTYVPETDC
jgi:hypothetical protein